MTLSQRTILIIVSTFFALLFILAVTSDVILLRSFALLERTVLAGNVQKIRNEIDETFDELNSSSKDLANQLASTGNTGLSGNHFQQFVNHHVDVIAILSASGRVLSSEAADFHNHKAAHLSQEDLAQLARVPVQASRTANGVVNGLILLGDKPLQMVMRPVADGKTMILAGRYLDKEEIRRVSRLTAFPIELFTLTSGNREADVVSALAGFENGVTNPSWVIDNDRIAGYSLFKDLFGQPVLIARIVEQRILYAQGKAAITYVILSLFLAGGVFCCVMLFFIRGSILKRIFSLNRAVRNLGVNRNVTTRLPISSEHDELADLAGSINSMLDSLESSEKELHESEERYRLLFERAPDSIIIIGLEDGEAGRIISANRAAADQHGYSVEELCQLGISDLNTEESNSIAAELTGRIAGGEWVTQEVWHYRKDGSKFPIEIHAGLVRFQGRNYILGFDRDITSRKLTEETNRMYLDRIRQLNSELRSQAADLAAANSELGAFNYSVSHDMRGPLTRISGYCQLLLDDESGIDSQARTYISRINDAGLWLGDMIDSLLLLAKLSRAEYTPDSVNLSDIAESVVQELRLSEPDRMVQTIIEKDVIAGGDACLLKILMTNLIGNAWKYSSRTADALIEFGTCPAGSVPIYFVRDNGAGFDMKHADKLFSVFSRLHDASQFSGTGIGLATVQRIVTRHGGRIWAEAETGRGATFFFTLQQEPSHSDNGDRCGCNGS